MTGQRASSPPIDAAAGRAGAFSEPCLESVIREGISLLSFQGDRSVQTDLYPGAGGAFSRCSVTSTECFPSPTQMVPSWIVTSRTMER